jgi:hypothetical protein
MQRYRSLHPNHVHQLTVSVSKHYWLTNDGILKFQHKKMEVPLDKVDASKKTHLIHYIIRDHFSGVVYSEVATSRKNISLEEFMFRAWNQKDRFVFCGIPVFLTVPKTVENVFPNIKQKVSRLGVEFPTVTSGFQAGVRDVKTIEEYMKFYAELPFEENHSKINDTHIYVSTMDSRTGKQSKIELWRKHIDTVTVPPTSWPGVA